jgi:hypothetical protein
VCFSAAVGLAPVGSFLMIGCLLWKMCAVLCSAQRTRDLAVGNCIVSWGWTCRACDDTIRSGCVTTGCSRASRGVQRASLPFLSVAVAAVCVCRTGTMMMAINRLPSVPPVVAHAMDGHHFLPPRFKRWLFGVGAFLALPRLQVAKFATGAPESLLQRIGELTQVDTELYSWAVEQFGGGCVCHTNSS